MTHPTLMQPGGWLALFAISSVDLQWGTALDSIGAETTRIKHLLTYTAQNIIYNV